MVAVARFVLVWLLLTGGAWGQGPPGATSGQNANELQVNGPVFENSQPGILNTPFMPWRIHKGTIQFLYAVDLRPGTYSLGLVLPVPTRQLAVSFFDRFPLDPASSRVQLPTRPVVRTRVRGERYLWQFSISPRSAANRLYVLVELAPLGRPDLRRPHGIFVTSQPIKPSLSEGQGLTFLQGPRQFPLGGEVHDPGSEPVTGPSTAPLLPAKVADLLQNGFFRAGLDPWTASPVNPAGLLLTPAGLRLRSGDDGTGVGVTQKLEVEVDPADDLLLAGVVKTERAATEESAAGTDRPVMTILLCYRDVGGGEHCGDYAYRLSFFAREAGEPAPESGEGLDLGTWTSFVRNIGKLVPPPQLIRTVTIEGPAGSGREAWISEIHLTQTEGRP